MEQIDYDGKDKQPVLIRNYYMSPFYFFGWSELGQDMEAQNFFLSDKDGTAKETIKVYPSLDIKTDLPKKFRNAQPESLGITIMKTGLFCSLQFLSAQYFRMQQVILEGD